MWQLGQRQTVNHTPSFLNSPSLPPAGNPDEFDRVMRVNALAPMRLIRALAPKMVDKARCVCRAA